jgi:hypothetical protein
MAGSLFDVFCFLESTQDVAISQAGKWWEMGGKTGGESWFQRALLG